MRLPLLTALMAVFVLNAPIRADSLPLVSDVEGQPLAANVQRLIQAMELVGAPIAKDTVTALDLAIKAKDVRKLQELLDPLALVQVTINPESRVKVVRGPATVKLQQAGFVPVVVKVVNEATVKKTLRISSPQAGPVYSTREINKKFDERFLHVEMFQSPPMTADLSGLKLEYAIALIYSAEAGKREATIGFDVGQGNQDLGFRGEVPILFDVKPGIPVKLRVLDHDGKPTVARFTFRDESNHVYPTQLKRLAPDFFFHQQIYREDGGTVLLPPGELTMEFGRGPEYQLITQKIKVRADASNEFTVKLQRWIDPMQYGFYNGDHHIHAAGCAHYTSPTEGVMPQDMFLHIKGEGMNVGCCLTWGPCFDFQRNFFEPNVHKLSEPLTLLKYDLEISGFGSQAMGHVCLLNLRDQTYPGSEGTKVKGWPTWTTPAMRWAKLQGGVTGYAHSGNGLQINPTNAAPRLIRFYDTNGDGKLSAMESKTALLPKSFGDIDRDADGSVTLDELLRVHEQVIDQFTNYAIPEMGGIGAQEIAVTTAQGLCDFISAMDTARVPEWNCWYHLMNCGFPLKASGETDFPCISGSRVGMGRVYVQMGKIDKIDYTDWCLGIAKGRSYVSDGYGHALEFKVNDKSPGFGDVMLDKAGNVKVKAKVAFAPVQVLGTAVGGPLSTGKTRKIELIVNGEVAKSIDVDADAKEHDLTFDIPIERSSWVALRHFPSMHTNPVNVMVGGKPIRGSKRSAQWCIGMIEQLWRMREMNIIPAERTEAKETFEKVLKQYRAIVEESPEGS